MRCEMRISRFAEVVMNHLRTTQWKSTLEIYNDIKKEWKDSLLVRCIIGTISFLGSKDAAEKVSLFLSGPSLGKLYGTLGDLKEQGFVEDRFRDDPPEILKLRGGRKAREWRLTQDGVRVRHLFPGANMNDNMLPVSATG